MKRLLTLLTALLLICAMTALTGCGGGSGEEDAGAASGTQEAAAEGIGIHHAEITIRDYGVVKVELDGDTAPITVQNFINLANDGFYDGLTFHRIINGFMIQGGDPNGNGTGGSEEEIIGEFEANGIPNGISHEKGVISMARRGDDMDSASSQFFIMVEDAPDLDGQYAAFGRVTEGQEIVDQIAKDANPTDNNGSIAPGDQPVIESVRITD